MNTEDSIGFKVIPQPVVPDIVIERPKYQDPDLLELIANFYGFVSRLSVKGVKTVPKAVYDERTAICNACEYYKPEQNLGWGKCNHRKCGCTKFKRVFAKESCPLPEPKWEAYG